MQVPEAIDPHPDHEDYKQAIDLRREVPMKDGCHTVFILSSRGLLRGHSLLTLVYFVPSKIDGT